MSNEQAEQATSEFQANYDDGLFRLRKRARTESQRGARRKASSVQQVRRSNEQTSGRATNKRPETQRMSAGFRTSPDVSGEAEHGRTVKSSAGLD